MTFDPKPHWRALRSVWRMLSLTVLLLPILLLGIAIYLSLRSQGTTRPPAE